MDLINNMPSAIAQSSGAADRSPEPGSSSNELNQGIATNSELGQQEFLQLLVAQMQNQDPINPMDGAEFAAQLAQFNSVEQLINLNQGLGSLQESQNEMSSSLTNSMAANLSGKEVKALSDQVWLDSGDGARIQYKLNSSASEVEIVVRSNGGSEVRREVIQGAGAGDNSWEWDGRNNVGERMAEGDYEIEVHASSEGSPVESLTYIEGVARKVRYTGQGIYLNVNQVDVPIGNVEEVGLRQ